ncbi:MAG: restriction endonuclease subunit R [Chromatiales bacterium 21-64-14]|nr:MAG: restriction endonuclease subunit R [Chromatiales bacterium 21-64-14]HQU17208.1 HsdR family type I site-specific deoxyribonuclease [Gammaproteobacteria bacterium]
MSSVGQREILTQRRVIAFFRDVLGYAYLGHWQDREGNSNVEEDLLSRWLRRQGHGDKIIQRTLFELNKAAALGGSATLYDANRAVYGLLRYGVKVRPEVGERTVTVWLVDWEHPEDNDFAIAEEVTVCGVNTKRPDLVLYVNGIALGVLELKRSTVSVTEGIRQQWDSQKKEFIRPFYTTVQLVLAGNDTEGLRYAVIETREKYWLRWKESEAHPDAGANPLLRALSQLCRKARLLEIVHDFMVFDAGNKKTCRHNQYFGVRAAQVRVRRREGGILWHTQGSGKSLIMVWLAKWIREHVADARVLVITDRTELDEQIEKVFKGVNEGIYRTRSGADLVRVLNTGEEWLVCSLIHKFGTGEEMSEKDIETYVEEIKKSLPKGFRAKGDIYVFVDECHRTQSGKLHEAMKALLPETMLIGFTGTPLLKSDKRRSIETFGPYIHTYKYDEAVRDGVVLDLRYEARDIDQNITSQEKVDQWFDLKTRGLTDVAKAQLKQRWGTMQKVLSARDRLEKIAADILLDMETRDRLRSGHGNALLVSDSIYSACRFYELFDRTDLQGKCAIITSYQPRPADIKGEDSGEGLTEKLLQYNVYRKMLAEHFDEPIDTAMYKVEQFEQEMKRRFIDEPGRVKLLIVVDKLLTGFDAPPATYLYIDKHMQDHGLFQAICRVNRLDGEDKEYGYIIDYKDLFRSLEQSIKDYTGEAFAGYDKEDVDGLLKDRLGLARERLEETREAIKALCEAVAPPCDTAAYLRYFCAAESGNAQELKDHEPKRVALYKMAGALLRAYANLANEMPEAGYSEDEIRAVRAEVDHYEKVREEVKLASGDYVDMKVYEPAMRHLLDTYIRAEESEKLSAFDDRTLVELIVERGAAAVEALPAGLRNNRQAMAETIENNVRRLIIDEMAVNPKYYERMSALLDALIEQRRQGALDYRAYLAQIVALTRRVRQPETRDYPVPINSPARRALYDNLKPVEGLEARVRQEDMVADRERDLAATTALALDHAIRAVKKADWRGNRIKEREVHHAIASVILDQPLAATLFEIVKAQRDY